MLEQSTIVPAPFTLSIVLFALIGALSAALANRGVSVFHDGLRPVMRSYRLGELPRREVSRTSFNLAWGFLWAFGLPYSVGFIIPLAYVIFMATDWIGVTVPTNYRKRWYQSGALQGVASSLALGALWGAGTFALLRLVTEAMHRAPVEMAEPVQLFAEPVTGAFFLFAVLTIAYHYGYRRAAVVLVASAVAWAGGLTADVGYPSVWAFAVAVAFLLVFVVMEARRSSSQQSPDVFAWAVEEDDEDDEDDLFVENVRRIRRNLVPLVLLSALMGAAYNAMVFTNDPIAGLLYQSGLAVPAAIVAFAWAFAFTPMKLTTAVVTGTMATHTFIELGVAVLMPNPLVAALAVGVLRVVEVMSLLAVVRGLERFPTVREVADVMRTAIFHVMEIGFLIGGALAAARFAGEWGVAIVIAVWFLNSRKEYPIMPISVGAYAALAVGVVANIMAAFGLSFV
jgi:hypothetical protein